jgi:hypothetical protein
VPELPIKGAARGGGGGEPAAESPTQPLGDASACYAGDGSPSTRPPT